jgi:hypothetical protein
VAILSVVPPTVEEKKAATEKLRPRLPSKGKEE